eukprot:Partr_v1_DN28571_c0_g1_i2_m73991 putative WD repeat containing, antisense to TP73
MDFTELYRQNIVQFSPDGQLIATAVEHRLVIRDAESLQILALFNNPTPSSIVEWSMDSQLVMCACYSTSKFAKGSRGWIRVYKVVSSASGVVSSDSAAVEWSAQIDEGLAGLVRCQLSPGGGRLLMAWSDFKLRLNIYRLDNPSKQVYYVKFPKSERCFDFRCDGRYFCIGERSSADGKDYVSIVDVESMDVVKYFCVQPAVNIESMHWSPCGQFIAIVDTCLTWRVLIYSPVGRLLHSISSPPSGCLLGVKAVQWSPSGQFLALLGAEDRAVSIVNHLTWSSVIDLDLSSLCIDASDSIPVFVEVSHSSIPVTESQAAGVDGVRFKAQYQLAQYPVTLPSTSASLALPSLMAWSSDGKYLAMRLSNRPSLVIIFDVSVCKFAAILLHLSPIRNFHWNPSVADQLILGCQNSGFVYWWTPSGCSSIQIPAGISFYTCCL